MSNKVVAIDVGHGWGSNASFDYGSSGNGTTEYEINSKVAWLIKDELEKKGLFVYVFDYASDDSPKLFLREKGNKASEIMANLFVSIHLGSSDGGKINGTQTFVDDDATYEDIHFAKLIQSAVTRELKYRNLGIKKEKLSILRGCSPMIPACLIEGFFIDWCDFFGHIPEPIIKGYARGVSCGIEQFFAEYQ